MSSKLIKMLEYMKDDLEATGNMPLVGKVAVDKKEYMRLIAEALDSLPRDVKEADEVLKQRDQIIQQADIQLSEAYAKSAQEMKVAEEAAAKMLIGAKQESKEMLDSSRATAMERIEVANKQSAEVLEHAQLQAKSMLSEAQEEAERIKRQYDELYQQKINNHEYVKEAQKKGEYIVRAAEEHSEMLTRGANHYAAEKVLKIEEDIKKYRSLMLDKLTSDAEQFLTAIRDDFDMLEDEIQENKRALSSME